MMRIRYLLMNSLTAYYEAMITKAVLKPNMANQRDFPTKENLDLTPANAPSNPELLNGKPLTTKRHLKNDN